MKNITLLLLALLLTETLLISNIKAQKIDKENIYPIESLRKNTNLRNLEYDPETGTTTLTYLENNTFNLFFRQYEFDQDLNFVEESEEEFSFGKKFLWENDIKLEELRDRHSWFDFRGDDFKKDFIDISHTGDYKLKVRKGTLNYKYSWLLGGYRTTVEKGSTVKLGGENDERIYPYEKAINTETGDLYVLIGVMPPIKERKGRAFEHCQKFQIVKISPDLKVEYLEKISFDYNMGISFTQVITPNNEPTEMVGDMHDIANGQWLIMFSPINTLYGKKFVNKENPGAHKVIQVNSDGTIYSQIGINAPSSGWVIEGAVAANDGKSIYIYGPAKDDTYVNKLKPINSPLTIRENIRDIKYKNFQIMKITDGKEEYLSSTELSEFKEKSVIPPSQKQTPEYIGKNLEKSLLYVTPDGQLLIVGQKYTTKRIDDPADTDSSDGQAKIKVKDKFKDLLMFHFDAKGILKSTYGIRRDFNNQLAKSNPTPQNIYLNQEGTKIYWVYNEIKGNRRGITLNTDILGGLGQISTVARKAKLLTFPAVSVVDLQKGSMSDFAYLGTNEKGNSEFFTFPGVPPQVSSDGKYLSFVGEDKSGKRLWLARMVLD